MVLGEQTRQEINTVCSAGVDYYIKERNKEVISNRIDEGLIAATFVSSLYLLYNGLNDINFKMVFAPFIAGGAYALIGSKQAKNKEAEYRLSFEDVCSNLRVEDED